MIKKTITYTDFNDIERKEDFYFNLTKAEAMEMELGTEGGMTAMLNRIVNAKDVPSLTKVFKEMILKSYGVKSDDGRRFIKSQEIRDAFEQTEAYSVLFMELISDEAKATDFIKGVVPKQTTQNVPAPQLIVK